MTAKFKTRDEILQDIERLREDMALFLTENRQANGREGLPLEGPAVRDVERALQGLTSTFQSIVRPESVEVVNWDRGLLGH